MPRVSVVMPVYNVQKYVAQAIQSVLEQTYQDFELLIIDDQSPDDSVSVCQQFQDQRIHIIHQQNLGLAGARNTGIQHAKGEYIAFLDADDYWAPEKLEQHIAHLRHHPSIGVSYCPSAFVDDHGCFLGIKQTPKLKNITIEDVFCRNPVGNGSAPVIRKAVFDDIVFPGHSKGIVRNWYFDETFKQSEDIECWLRIATQTKWQFEGIASTLTFYRVNEQGLSANVFNQFESWRRARQKLATTAPEAVNKWGKLAEAYQLRYLARRAIRSRNAALALKLVLLAIKTHFKIVLKEPARTLNTLVCALLINLLPKNIFCQIESIAMNINHFTSK